MAFFTDSLAACDTLTAKELAQPSEGSAAPNAQEEDSCKHVPDPRLSGRGWRERWPPPKDAKRRRTLDRLPEGAMQHEQSAAADRLATVSN